MIKSHEFSKEEKEEVVKSSEPRKKVPEYFDDEENTSVKPSKILNILGEKFIQVVRNFSTVSTEKTAVEAVLDMYTCGYPIDEIYRSIDLDNSLIDRIIGNYHEEDERRKAEDE